MCQLIAIAMTTRFKDWISSTQIWWKSSIHTPRTIFEILLNQTVIRLYLKFADWFGIKWTSACFQINRKIVNIIKIWFDLIRFRKVFSVSRLEKLPRSAVRETRGIQKIRVTWISANITALQYRETLNWVTIRPRDFSLSESWNDFFPFWQFVS